jgi:hypothetical protein
LTAEQEQTARLIHVNKLVGVGKDYYLADLQQLNAKTRKSHNERM